jgi:hypothetical protein
LFLNYNYKSLQIRLNHVGKHCNFHHKTLWITTVFSIWLFFFFWCLFRYFFKLFLSIFFNIELIKILALLFFSLKHCELLQCFPMWFFYDLLQNYLCRFFFNIKLVKNYNYNKTKSYEESVVVFFTKHCGLLQYFSK